MLKKKTKTFDPRALLAKVRTKLQHYSSGWTPKSYLAIDEELSAVLGTSDGIPWGIIIELSGPESSGKSGLALSLMGLAQTSGAYGIWVDAENSLKEYWATKRGVDYDTLVHVHPYVGKFGKKPSKRNKLTSAEALCAEAEEVAATIYDNSDGDCCIFMVVDSVTALLTKEELEAGLENQNMRTANMALPKFLGQLLRRWVGLCQTYNMTILFVNQLRTNPMQMFGNPEYEPGGKALKFYSHIRARMRRGKSNGVMMKAGKQIGIKGVIRNVKNKAGGTERLSCGYKILFRGTCKFLSSEQLEKGE